MIVSNQVRVDGELIVSGELYITDIKQLDPVINLPPDNFSYYNIPVSTIIDIPINQEMYLRDSIKIDGNLVVNGKFSVGNTFTEPALTRLVNNVLINKFYTVDVDEEYSFRNFLKINGEVINRGFITIGV